MARSGRGLAMSRTLNSPAQFAQSINRLAHHVRIRIVPKRADLIDGSRITDVADDSRYSCAHLRIGTLQLPVKLVRFGSVRKICSRVGRAEASPTSPTARMASWATF